MYIENKVIDLYSKLLDEADKFFRLFIQFSDEMNRQYADENNRLRTENDILRKAVEIVRAHQKSEGVTQENSSEKVNEKFSVNDSGTSGAAVNEEKTLTKEEVRSALAVIAKDGHRRELKALLEKYGAKKLGEVDPKDYEALLKEAEEIGRREDHE